MKVSLLAAVDKFKTDDWNLHKADFSLEESNCDRTLSNDEIILHG